MEARQKPIHTEQHRHPREREERRGGAGRATGQNGARRRAEPPREARRDLGNRDRALRREDRVERTTTTKCRSRPSDERVIQVNDTNARHDARTRTKRAPCSRTVRATPNGTSKSAGPRPRKAP